jgi:hypothetical protein
MMGFIVALIYFGLLSKQAFFSHSGGGGVQTGSTRHRGHLLAYCKHNRSEMVAVLGPFEALPYYILLAYCT